MDRAKIKFSKAGNTDMITLLRKRVDEYFASRNISKTGNTEMVIKTISMISLYSIPYVLMVTGVFSNAWILFGMWILMGFGMAGIGLSIMHDANHGSYSKHAIVNKALGFLLNFVGGSAVNWQMQHNILHHSYTNIDGLDEDITRTKIMRFSPHQERRKAHRFQHIYAWFLYSLMTLEWVVWKDFPQLIRYHRMGLTKIQTKTFRRLLAELIISKVIYFGYIVVIPLLFMNISWWQFIIFFLSMHLLAGFILAVIFQPAHVVPSSEYPVPSEEGQIENAWAVHQLLTTSDFAPRSKVFSWLVGGLNFQVEHHLFPNICHVHYRAIAKIVAATTQELGLPYHVQSTYLRAIWNHGSMLRRLGKYD
jgi:linoleoyl-CoA desaturase